MRATPRQIMVKAASTSQCVAVDSWLSCAHDSERQLRQVIRRQSQRDLLHDFRQEHERHPQSAAERHRQINQVDGRGRRVRSGEISESQTHRPKTAASRATRVPSTLREIGERHAHAAEGDPEREQREHDDRAENHAGDHFRREVCERRHGAGALHLQPSQAAVGGQARRGAEQRRAHHAERAVGCDQIRGHGRAADGFVSSSAPVRTERRT